LKLANPIALLSALLHFRRFHTPAQINDIVSRCEWDRRHAAIFYQTIAKVEKEFGLTDGQKPSIYHRRCGQRVLLSKRRIRCTECGFVELRMPLILPPVPPPKKRKAGNSN
jgi:ribosomal protein L37E